MAKVDLSHAFMHFDISDYFGKYTGFSFDGEFYHYKKLPWGTTVAPYVLQAFTESIADLLKKRFD